MAGRILNRYKRHCKAADVLFNGGRYADTGKKKKACDGLLKWQGGREAKKTDKTQAARAFWLAPFSSFYTIGNCTIAAYSWAFCIMQIDNGSGAAFTFMH